MRTVSRLSIAPVKGMALVHPLEITLGPNGVAENRRFHIVDEDGRRYAQVRNGKLVRITRQAIFNIDVLALDIPEFAQPLPEAFDKGLGRGPIAQEPKAIDLPRLLGFGGAWGSQHRHRAVQERAPVHH